jgi:hypothetical protein
MYICSLILKDYSSLAAKEHVIFQRFSGSNIFSAKKNPFPSVKLNAYTPANPKKALWLHLMKLHTEAAFITLG